MTRRFKIFWLGVAVVTVAMAYLADYLAGVPVAGPAFFVLFPVAIGTWALGPVAGLLLSATLAIAWAVIDSFGRSAGLPLAYPVVACAVQFGIYAMVTLLVAALRNGERTKEEMTAFLVHDLRAPLAGILTTLTVFSRNTQTPLDEKQRKLLALALGSGNRMATMIDTILSLRRLEDRSIKPSLDQFGLGELIETAAAGMAAWAEGYGVEIDVQAPADLPEVHADPELTRRVVLNLLTNAVSFSPRGSAVTVAARESNRGEVAVSISDQGPGIPKEWQRKVFGSSVQAPGQERWTKGSSGLGLAFSRLAVRMQCGQIGLDSTPGEGTTVTFTLPVARGTAGKRVGLSRCLRRVGRALIHRGVGEGRPATGT